MALRYILITVVAAAFVHIVACQIGMPGGWSEEQAATDFEQQLVDRIKPHVERLLDQRLSTFEAVRFRVQTVDGWMYKVKVNIGSEYIHVRIYQNWDIENRRPVLENFEGGKTLNDEI